MLYGDEAVFQQAGTVIRTYDSHSTPFPEGFWIVFCFSFPLLARMRLNGLFTAVRIRGMRRLRPFLWSLRTKVFRVVRSRPDEPGSLLRRDVRSHPAPLLGCVPIFPSDPTLTEGLVKTASDSPRIWRYLFWIGSSGSAKNLRSSVRFTITETNLVVIIKDVGREVCRLFQPTTLESLPLREI